MATILERRVRFFEECPFFVGAVAADDGIAMGKAPEAGDDF